MKVNCVMSWDVIQIYSLCGSIILILALAAASMDLFSNLGQLKDVNLPSSKVGQQLQAEPNGI